MPAVQDTEGDSHSKLIADRAINLVVVAISATAVRNRTSARTATTEYSANTWGCGVGGNHTSAV